MENIEEIKIMWQDLNRRLANLEDDNKKLIQNIREKHYKTTQEKLVNKYACFIALEVVMICFMTLFFLNNPFFNVKYKTAALIFWNAFFLMEVFFDLYLLYQIKQIDIYNSTIKEVATRAANNWKLHKIGIAVGLPLAFGAIILFALAIDANEYTIYGMIFGGSIGLFIGIRQLLKFKNYYKLLQLKD